MHRRIMILLVASALVVAVHSASTLKCYMCTSLMNPMNCNSSFLATKSLEQECNFHNIREWQQQLAQHKLLKPISNLFEVDDSSLHYHQINVPMACAKMVLYISNQEVIVRTCQTAKTETIDPCKTMDTKMQTNQVGKVDQCSLCSTDICNGGTILSPEIFYTLLSFLGALIHVAFYHWA